MRRAIGAGALILAAAAAAGCQSSGSAGAGAASASPPAVASWQLGGAYTGPVPPATGLPSPAGGIRFAPATDAKGYTEQLTVRVGAPLHYRIPRVLEDCYTAYPGYRGDLDPGTYVIPVQAVITNHTAQQAPAADPEINALDADGNTVPMTDELHMTWATGGCRTDVLNTMPQGGQTTLTGFIGPATASQLTGTWLRVNGRQYKLTTLEPHRTASWLVARS